MADEGTNSFIETLLAALESAAAAQWLKVGVVDSYSSPEITATIDGGTVTGIRRIGAAYATPANGDVVLFGVVRGNRSVQYVALGVIT